jgi:alpha-L-fucosidase
VIQTLVDVVSKNGNLLLSVPVRGDGTIDEKEQKIVEDIGDWMQVNQEGIIATRPWKVFGEGPASAGAALSAQGFNEGKGKPFTAADIRFTSKGDTLYAIVLGWPTNAVQIKSLGTTAKLQDKSIASIALLGSDEPIQWSQAEDAVTIEPPQNKPSDHTIVFKIAFR